MSKTKSITRAIKAAASSIKRAAIYVRVSSEKQADKVSPEAQEADCRALAERQGYMVTAVYRDIQKYRAGRKLVEPSGTRADRPALRQMLADARAGKFDVMLAWREDRLYRSYRPMLDVLECLEETGLDVELAKETFDKRMMGGKVWVAKMELDAKHDRLIMGTAGRLADGKALNFPAPYGYTRVGDVYETHEDEAYWVRKMFEWCASGIGTLEVRRRLIAGGAMQRKKNPKYPWHLNIIRGILKAEYYWTGEHITRWDGNEYAVPIPPIIDPAVAQKVKRHFTNYKAYPAGHLKADVQGAGLVHCPCGARMSVKTVRVRDSKRSGAPITKTIYSCPQHDNHAPGVGIKYIGAKKVDADLWNKVWGLVAPPGKLEEAIQERVTELQAQEFDASAECTKLQGRLDELAMKRQELIAWAQDKIITKEDLALRLAALSFQQAEAERELRDKSLLIGNRAERLLAVARAYREAVLDGAVDVTKEPESDEEAARLWQFKKTMIQGLVTRVDVLPDRTIKVKVQIKFTGKLPEGISVDDDRISNPMAHC